MSGEMAFHEMQAHKNALGTSGEQQAADITGPTPHQGGWKQVEQSRSQVQAIGEKVSLAQAKIEKIKGSKKAIKVFSSAKYPAPGRLQEYGSIFTGAQDPGLQRRPRHRIQSKHRPLDERALQEKLKDFPVCVSTKPEPEDDAEEGLGGLPSNISSVSSLLLFNTTENL
uniref:cDNA FLJ50976 n=2 Tax=Homo sapiens TaxID=9606 RepID=B4DJQ2_HUMAN|nr:unnamed protein product [Homo sapiens]BAH14858.1 unnamed protein product [Homo sapiens]